MLHEHEAKTNSLLVPQTQVFGGKQGKAGCFLVPSIESLIQPYVQRDWMLFWLKRDKKVIRKIIVHRVLKDFQEPLYF